MIIDDYIAAIGRKIWEQWQENKPVIIPALKGFEWAQLLRYLELKRVYAC